MLQNTVPTNKLEVDVESLILKISSHFSKSAKRRANLQLQFQANEMQWEEIVKHVATRFLSLGPAVERIIKIWPALKSHFLESRDECPRLLQNIITSEEEESKTLAYLAFLHNVMFSIETTMKKIESDSLSIVEMHAEMHGICEKMEQRLKDNFFGSQARQITSGLSTDAKETIENDFRQFYTNFIEYLTKRYDFSESNILSKMLFLNLKAPINYEHFQKAAELLRIDQLNMEDLLYEEFQIIKKSLEIATSLDDKSMGAIEKWKKIMEGFSRSEIPNIFLIISFVFSIPSSNCFVERIFSQMALKWTDVRNKCTPDLIKSELMTVFNYDYSCIEFYKYVKSNKDMLKLTRSSLKYT